MNLISLAVLSILAQAGAQPADPDAKGRAQLLLKEGAHLYQESAFADALEKFNQAYAVFPSPKLLFNIGQASRELGRPADSVDAFEKFLKQAPDASIDLLTEARRSVEELSPKIGKLFINCNVGGAEIAVDGKTIGKTPLADFIRVNPGSHQITATHAAAVPVVQSTTIGAGTLQTIGIRMQGVSEAGVSAPMPTPTSTASAPSAPAIDLQSTSAQAATSHDGWWLGRRWTWVAAGAGIVLAAGGAIAGMAMQSKFDSLNGSCGVASAKQQGCTQGDLDAIDSRRDAANIMWGLAGAAAVTAGILFYFEGRPVSLLPVAGNSTGVVAQVRY